MKFTLKVNDLKKDEIRQVFKTDRETVVKFSNKSNNIPSKPINFDSIGGLQKEIKAIREMVEIPLSCPERFIKYGLVPPRGLLLYGPPGTGKTLIARAVACETCAYVIVINGPEILSKNYGETEQKLKSIFEEAEQNQPSIIFFDEIDAICPKRDKSETQLEKRIVTTLLTLMDGADNNELSSRSRVFVIGATNRPNSIDDALRRPGRFDREFEIGIPDALDRLDILTKMMKSIPNCLSADDIELINSKAHGYVGADLAAVCREAGLNAIQRVQSIIGENATDDQISSNENLLLKLEDMLFGMSIIRPSVIREITIEVPKVYW